MTRGAITNIELNKTEPKPLFVALVCKTFGINEIWLRTGIGEMRTERSLEEEIAEFAAKIINYGSESFQARFVHALSKLDESDWDVLSKIADEMQKNSKKEE